MGLEITNGNGKHMITMTNEADTRPLPRQCAILLN